MLADSTRITRTRLLAAIGVLSLRCAAGLGATVVYDFNTDCGVPCYGNLCGTLWDGTTTMHAGSLNWQQTRGAGFVGSTTNGPMSGVSGDGFLQLTFASALCDGVLGSFLCGAELLNEFDNGNPVTGFNFECDLRMGNGDPAPNGGFSVSFIRTNDPVFLALNAGDLLTQMNDQVSPNGGRFSDCGNGSDLSLPEQGTTTGISVGFQMADNGDYRRPPDPGAVGLEAAGIKHAGIGLHVRVDGTVIAAVPMPNGTTQQTYDQNGNPLIATDPNGTNAATDVQAIETGPCIGSGCDTNLLWAHFKMQLLTNGLLNVWWKNLQVITNLPTNLAPFAGMFLMAASAGSKPANIDLDNVAITTLAVQAAPLDQCRSRRRANDHHLHRQPAILFICGRPLSDLEWSEQPVHSPLGSSQRNTWSSNILPLRLVGASSQGTFRYYLDAPSFSFVLAKQARRSKSAHGRKSEWRTLEWWEL